MELNFQKKHLLEPPQKRLTKASTPKAKQEASPGTSPLQHLQVPSVTFTAKSTPAGIAPSTWPLINFKAITLETFITRTPGTTILIAVIGINLITLSSKFNWQKYIKRAKMRVDSNYILIENPKIIIKQNKLDILKKF